MLHQTSGHATLGSYQYQYNGASDVTQRTDNDGSVTTFGYDNADQVTSEARTGTGAYSIGYTYDHNGNRLTKVQGGVTDTYTYDTHDKLQSTSHKSYTYDYNGNVKTVTSGGVTTTLTYDYDDQLTGLSGGGISDSFSYNGLGLRVSKTDASGTHAFVTDGSDVASAVLSDGAAVYTPGLSERRSGASKFYHADALGSTRGITNSSQTATDSILYDAFGMTVSRTGTTPTPFGFVGTADYQTDGDTGLLLLGHRYYDPSIGRFISQDPIGDGDNWYEYCDNNPLAGTDPMGLQTIDQSSPNNSVDVTGTATQIKNLHIHQDGLVNHVTIHILPNPPRPRPTQPTQPSPPAPPITVTPPPYVTPPIGSPGGWLGLAGVAIGGGIAAGTATNGISRILWPIGGAGSGSGGGRSGGTGSGGRRNGGSGYNPPPSGHKPPYTITTDGHGTTTFTGRL